MKRRAFLALCGGIAASWAPSARAQQRSQIRLGLLSPFPLTSPVNRRFIDELRMLGYEEGRNLTVEFRQFGNNANDLTTMQALATELVQAKVDLILVEGPGEAALRAVSSVTQALPIVVIAVNFDPLESGYVSSLARPRSNLTGVALRLPELAAKQIELASELSRSPRLAILWDEFTADQFRAASKVAQARGLEVKAVKLESRPYDFSAAFRSLATDAPSVTLVFTSAYHYPQRVEMAQAAIRHRVPTMFVFRYYVDAGGLLSYGPDQVVMRRRAISYVGRILKGADPADLPFEQPTKWELVINLKTAAALSFDVSPLLLARADEVIE